MNSITRMFIVIEMCLMTLSGAALFFSAQPLVSLFSKSDQVIALGTSVLRMVALSEPLYGIALITEGFMMGVGKTKTPFVYNIIGMWGVRILGTFICTQLLDGGLVAAWGCMIAHNVLLCILYFITYIRGNWNPLQKN